MKYKVHTSDSFVLCGFTKGERDHFGALVLGIHDRRQAEVGRQRRHGFDRKMMKAIHDKLAPLAIDKCPLEPDKNLPKKDVTWVRPELVCEVEFANWTEDGRLRAPVLWACGPISIRRSAFARPATIRRRSARRCSIRLSPRRT